MAKISSKHQAVLKELLAADRRARERVRREREKADEMMAEAKEEADSVVENARRKAEQEADRIVEDARKESRARASAPAAETVFAAVGPTDAEALSDRARNNMDAAVAVLVDWVTAKESDR